MTNESGTATRTRSLPVVVIDEVPIRRRGIGLALQEAGLEVVDPAGPGAEKVAASVVWVGADTDLEQTIALAASGGGVVVAIFECSSVYLFRRALAAGIAPVCADESSPEEIAQVVREALHGKVVMSVAMASQLAEGAGAFADPRVLSGDETTWIRSLAEGDTVALVAKRVGISEREMYRHLHDLYERMGVETRAEALVRAAQWGVIKLPD